MRPPRRPPESGANPTGSRIGAKSRNPAMPADGPEGHADRRRAMPRPGLSGTAGCRRPQRSPPPPLAVRTRRHRTGSAADPPSPPRRRAPEPQAPCPKVDRVIPVGIVLGPSARYHQPPRSVPRDRGWLGQGPKPRPKDAFRDRTPGARIPFTVLPQYDKGRGAATPFHATRGSRPCRQKDGCVRLGTLQEFSRR